MDKIIPNIRSLIDNSLNNFESVLWPIINITTGNNIKTLIVYFNKIKKVSSILNF